MELYWNGFVAGSEHVFQGLKYICPQGVTAGAVEQVVINYLQSHPEKWGEDPSLSVFYSMHELYPCKSSGSSKNK